MKVISIRENPDYCKVGIEYIQKKWPQVSPQVYEDCIKHSITSDNPLPQWYLLEKDNNIIGCAGLITNDFISRMDLYPWVCAVFIEEEHRGNSYSSLLLQKAKDDAQIAGFKNLYLSTDHIGFYEKYGFEYIGQGYHPWFESSRIYKANLRDKLDFGIRAETSNDFDEVYNLIRIAFETAKVKDGDEQDFAVKLRNSSNYIPQLSLVAEHKNQLIGHIMLTKSYVTQPDGSKFESLLLAPISVLLEYRDKGVGSALINESFRLARNMGYKAVFLCGDPAYYHKFGFEPTSIYGIRPKSDIPQQYVMVHKLEADALSGVSGITDIC